MGLEIDSGEGAIVDLRESAPLEIGRLDAGLPPAVVMLVRVLVCETLDAG